LSIKKHKVTNKEELIYNNLVVVHLVECWHVKIFSSTWLQLLLDLDLIIMEYLYLYKYGIIHLRCVNSKDYINIQNRGLFIYDLVI
jgi:hypothetical protein